MELVLLADMQNSFGSNWARIANTEGVDKIQIGDRFREQGYGPGAEELEVSGVDISPVGGFSRLYFVRAANATQPEVHRLGAVLLPVTFIPALGQPNPIYASSAVSLTNQPANGSASVEEVMPSGEANLHPVRPDMTAGAQSSSEAPALVPLKRGRGRPLGSRNKAKPTAKAQEAEFPTGF